MIGAEVEVVVTGETQTHPSGVSHQGQSSVSSTKAVHLRDMEKRDITGFMLTPITSDVKEALPASPAPSLFHVLVTDGMSGLELARKVKCFATELNPLS